MVFLFGPQPGTPISIRLKRYKAISTNELCSFCMFSQDIQIFLHKHLWISIVT